MARYVVLDGMDGSGKGTQIRLLQEAGLNSVIFTREPGGTPFAETIRELVRDNPLAGEATPLTNLLLFFAARDELLEKVVTPALAGGKSVVSDRADSSSYAFQICGEEQEALEPAFGYLREQVFGAAGRRAPDLYIVYDLPAEMARERVMRDSARSTNHFDERPLEYYERVRAGFARFAERFPVRFVDATQSPDAMHLQTKEILAELGI